MAGSLPWLLLGNKNTKRALMSLALHCFSSALLSAHLTDSISFCALTTVVMSKGHMRLIVLSALAI